MAALEIHPDGVVAGTRIEQRHGPLARVVLGRAVDGDRVRGGAGPVKDGVEEISAGGAVADARRRKSGNPDLSSRG